jgi:Leucine-rich repeat (LRR) protein
MKITFKLIIFGVFILIGCNQKQIIQNKVEIAFKTNPKLTKSDNDTLFIQNRLDRDYFRFYDYKDGFAKLRNDTLFVIYSKGAFAGITMSIFITKGNFNFKINEYSCINRHTYKPIEQKLTLNKNRFQVNDTIVGEMFYKSIFVLDSIKNIVDTIFVKGKFKFRVRDSDYDFYTLMKENQYQEFIELSRNRPDTITTLILRNCGLKKLPEELSLFKNLEVLQLGQNDLNNADLSILASFKKMKIIGLERCNLHHFPIEVFNYKNLRELDLSNNNLKELPSGLFKMTSLRELSIGVNDFKILPSAIGNLKNLELLSLVKLSIKIFPETILQLTKLKDIFPPREMDYFPPKLAKCLNDGFNYRGIKNFEDFKKDIPKDQ